MTSTKTTGAPVATKQNDGTYTLVWGVDRSEGETLKSLQRLANQYDKPITVQGGMYPWTITPASSK